MTKNRLLQALEVEKPAKSAMYQTPTYPTVTDYSLMYSRHFIHRRTEALIELERDANMEQKKLDPILYDKGIYSSPLPKLVLISQ